MVIRCDAITRLNYINRNSKLLYYYYFKRRRIGQGYKRAGKKSGHSSMWCEFEMMGENDDDNSELSEHTRFLTKGAFLLTPSHDLSLDKAANICDKLNFRGSFSLTKTATGILFKFSEPDDYQQVFRKGFHKVTGGRLYRKVSIPCRPQKTFSLLVYEVPSDLPEDDIRASLYRYCSVVEVTRVPQKIDQSPGSPPPIRITVASLDEYNSLLQQGVDFYGATYFPTEPMKKDQLRGSKEKLLPVFDSAGFSRIPAPPTRTLKPIRS